MLAASSSRRSALAAGLALLAAIAPAPAAPDSVDQPAVPEKLRTEYRQQLDTAVTRLTEEGRRGAALAVRIERARLEANTITPEQEIASLPFEVLTLRKAYLERLAGALAPPRDLHRSPPAGGDGGSPFEDVSARGGLLTGLLCYTGDFAGHLVLTAVQPIFQVGGVVSPGKVHGTVSADSKRLEAAPGYAVGGVKLHSGDRVDGLELIFQHIRPGGRELDPKDSYESPWVGGEGGGPGEILAERPVTGIFGASGLELDSLGLIDELPRTQPGSKAEPVYEITREHAARVKVINLQAEPLNESIDPSAGRWRQVPEPLRGAQIYAHAVQKSGVLEFRTETAGRVYVACNYDYQGNSGGAWSEERWTEDDFIRHGWSRVEGMTFTGWPNRSYLLFTKELQKDEAVRLRCNKYEPPYLITFLP